MTEQQEGFEGERAGRSPKDVIADAWQIALANPHLKRMLDSVVSAAMDLHDHEEDQPDDIAHRTALLMLGVIYGKDGREYPLTALTEQLQKRLIDIANLTPFPLRTLTLEEAGREHGDGR